jgi:N-acetylmuramoyl-L-alanine amidase
VELGAVRGLIEGGLGARWGRLALGAAFAAVCVAAVAGAERPRDDVLSVRLGGDAQETRVVVDLDRPASGAIEASAANQISLTLAVGAAGARSGEGRGLVRRWRVVPAGGGARLTLELAEGARVERRFLLAPADGVAHYRYVVDLAPQADGARAPAAQPPAPARTQAAAFTLPHARKVIVIDAGHGGKDPGAAGAGSDEKALTLPAALALKARLERTGRYRVVMTRTADVFVPLEERVQIARRAGADLFISLHADSGPDPQTHGASVYTLSERGVGRVGYVLDRHDWFLQPAAAGDDHAVGQILLDLSQRSTRNRSALFAETLIERVGDRAPLLARSHRDADYFVLLAPDVPAVLLEMGFITNASDETRLGDPAQRDALMDDVADAIDAYFIAEAAARRALVQG